MEAGEATRASLPHTETPPACESSPHSSSGLTDGPRPPEHDVTKASAAVDNKKLMTSCFVDRHWCQRYFGALVMGSPRPAFTPGRRMSLMCLKVFGCAAVTSPSESNTAAPFTETSGDLVTGVFHQITPPLECSHQNKLCKVSDGRALCCTEGVFLSTCDI